MAHYNLEIGAPIAPISKPTCGYTLTIKYEHGDADSHTSETFFFSEMVESRVNDLQHVLHVLEFLQRHFPYDHERRPVVAAIVAGLGLERDTVDRFVDTYWVWDDCYMDNLATPNGWSLIYTDQYGVDHHVKVSIQD